MASEENTSKQKNDSRNLLPRRGRPPKIPPGILALFEEGDEVPGIGPKPIHRIVDSEEESSSKDQLDVDQNKNSNNSTKTTKGANSGRGKKLKAIKDVELKDKFSLLSSTAKCDMCGRTFSNVSGFKRHMKACQEAAGPALVVKVQKIPLNEISSDDPSEGEDNPSKKSNDVEDVTSKTRRLTAEEKVEESADPFCNNNSTDGPETRKSQSTEMLQESSVEDDKSYPCHHCGEVFREKDAFLRHSEVHKTSKPFECETCHRKFSRKYHLDRHRAQTGCDGRPKTSLPCQICGKEFSRKDNLREHLRGHAGQVKRKRKFACEFCNKEFFGLSMLQVHVRSHTGERPYPCSYCSKSFSSNNALQKHIRTHTGERPFECPDCKARFAAKETLNRHVRIHSGLKPHVCEYCGKGFIQPSQLKAHLFHHTGENGFECEDCGKSFNRRNRLMLHIKYVHEGAEPFSCDKCDKKFIRKEDLTRHQFLHEGVKPHRCDICEKSFSIKSALKVHLLTHTREPPTSCDECGRAFIRQDCLLRHMRLKHREMLEHIMAEAEKKKLQQQLLSVTVKCSEATKQEPSKKSSLEQNIAELLSLLVDETTLKSFGWPNQPIQEILEAVIRRCGHQPVSSTDFEPQDRLRENAKLLFTVVIDDAAVKTLLNNQTVDEVIVHVLHLAKA